jgi:hypothetical protein
LPRGSSRLQLTKLARGQDHPVLTATPKGSVTFAQLGVLTNLHAALTR